MAANLPLHFGVRADSLPVPGAVPPTNRPLVAGDLSVVNIFHVWNFDIDVIKAFDSSVIAVVPFDYFYPIIPEVPDLYENLFIGFPVTGYF